MFILSRLSSLVRIVPSEWKRPLPEAPSDGDGRGQVRPEAEDRSLEAQALTPRADLMRWALTDALNVQLANKVVFELGLVLSVYDLVSIGDSYLLPMDLEGASHTRVTFRVVVFRPFVEEVLQGKIKSCTRQGVFVSLGFFDDILIKPEALQHPKRFDETEQVWVWEYPTDEGHHDMFMDPGETIRFRVISEHFVDTSPSAPDLHPKDPSAALAQGSEPEDKKIPYLLHASVWVWEYPTDEGHHDMFMDPGETIRFRVISEHFVDTSPSAPDLHPKDPSAALAQGSEPEDKKIPYLLHASVNEPGLGLISWWNS
eukprot:snap_masked-scaffold50_size457468-processed-gene-0.1 protein:Tk03198 transcript:snap_masked-scaffold50_size457468-processed-gene-0.1-mRNA-1 annotation:"dna-directed rna polymerase iii subunit rpc8"